MRFHADALCSFWAMMAIVMQNTAVCRVAEASLRTVRALRRPQRALQRPLRHAQSLPFPSLSPSSGGRLNEFPSLQSAALVGFTRSAGRNDGWLGHSCGFRARAPLSMADNGCLLAAFAFAQFLGCFMRLGQLFLLCPASYGVLSNSFFDARGHRSRTMLKSHKSVMKITKSCRKV